ncbi:hypothetical protein Tco_0744265 [Tanacetum coccineum]
MLDTFTSEMCADPWGRFGFARALIKVSADKELKQEVIMAIPNEDGTGHTKECIKLEYEWKPPLCLDYHVFGHTPQQCPKRVLQKPKVSMEAKEAGDDGFTTVSNRHRKSKQNSNASHVPNDGLKINKPKMRVVWQKVNSKDKRPDKAGVNGDDINLVTLKNNFDVLRDQDDLLRDNIGETSNTMNDIPTRSEPELQDYESEVEELIMEPDNRKKNSKGASTPSTDVLNVVIKLRHELDEVQKALDTNPADLILREEEATYLQAFNEAKLDEERFLKQKAKIEWLEVGDSNSAYFHKYVKSRNQRCRENVIRNENFKAASGLVPSILKSTAFFCNVANNTKMAILNIMPFSKGKLPVKYLGVPLISSRLLNRDCKFLVESAKNRIGDWKNKSLSFDGRLQLCKSDISSMQVYWASVLAIPKGIIYDIQSLIQGFLWCNGEYKHWKAKVAWEVWLYIRHLPNMEAFNPSIQDILTHLQPIARQRTASSIVGKLLLFAFSFYICIERNNRLFKNAKRSPDELCDSIMVTVRLKLMMFRFKNTTNVTRMLDRWKMPKSFRLYGC